MYRRKPVSILDRDKKPDPIIVSWGNDITEFALLAVSLILIACFWIWVFYILWLNPPIPEYLLTCNPGMCATNYFNGEKRCLSDPTQSILYDPGYEVCNSKFSCDNKQTTYALLSDGSTNAIGVCEKGIECRCLTQPQCSTDTVTYFKARNDTVTAFSNVGSRLKYLQVAFPTQGIIGPPLILEDSNTQFCTLNINYFGTVVPRTKECSFTNIAPNINQIQACINSNPCITGRLVFKPSDFAQFKFDINTISATPVGCVPDVPYDIGVHTCTAGTVPVWDAGYEKIRCLS